MESFSYANYYPMNRILEGKGDLSGWLQNIRREYEQAIYRRNLMEAYGELARYYLVTKKTEKAAAIAAYMKAHPILDSLPSYWDKAMEDAMNALSPDSLPAFDEVVKDAGLGKGPHESAVKALDEVAERALTLHNEDTAERVYAYLYDLTQDSSYKGKAAQIKSTITVMKAATITITIILITMMRKERVMSDDKLIYFHKYDHHDGKELPEGLFTAITMTGTVTAAVVMIMIMMWMDSMPRSWEARNRAFSVKTALTPTKWTMWS